MIYKIYFSFFHVLITLDLVTVAHLCSHFFTEHKCYVHVCETSIQMNIEPTGLWNLEWKFSIKSTFFWFLFYCFDSV